MELMVIREDDELTHIVLSGELNLAGVGEIEQKFISYTSTRKKPAIVDMSEVSFVASLGVGMLFSVGRSMAVDGVKLILLNPIQLVETAMRTAGITEVLYIAHSMEEAETVIRGA